MAIWEALGKKRLGKGKTSDQIPYFPSNQRSQIQLGRGWNQLQMLNLPQNSLRKSLLCAPTFSFYTSLLAEVPPVLVAQLRRFSGRIFEAARSGSCSKSPIITALQEKHL